MGTELSDCGCSVPDPQLVRRIVSQVEFYLSDENLAKDAFLLKHVQKNKMGFVSIKLLTSFRKVGSRGAPGAGRGLPMAGVWVCPGCLWQGYGEGQVLLRLAGSRQSSGGAEPGSALCLGAAAGFQPGRVAEAAVNGPQPSPGAGVSSSAHGPRGLLVV